MVGKSKKKKRMPRTDSPMPSSVALGKNETNKIVPPPPPRWPVWILLLLLTITCFAIWYPTHSYPFHFDDRHSVRDNEEIRETGNLPKFLNPFKSFFSRGALKAGYILNYALAEKDDEGVPSPKSFHIANVLIHTINAALVFMLVFIFLHSYRPEISPTHRALAGAAVAGIFCMSPIQTCAVNLIASRSVMQAATFSLLSLIAIILALDKKRSYLSRTGLAFAALVAIALSLASKAVGIATIGLAALPLFTIFIRKERKLSIWEWFSFLLVIFVVGLGALVVANLKGEGWHNSSYGGIWPYFLTQTRVLLRYLRLLVYPTGLSVDPYVSPSTSIADPTTALALLTIIALIALGIFLLTRRNLLGVAILWYFIALAPSSSIVPRKDFMLEYRPYLAVVGYAGAAVYLIYAFAAFFRKRLSIRITAGKISTVLTGILIIILAVTTSVRNRVFANEIALWSDAAHKAPMKPRPNNNLGTVLMEDGQVDKAIEQYRYVLKIEPRHYRAHYFLGIALAEKGLVEDAIEEYRTSLSLRPDNELVEYNLALLLKDLGQNEEAIVELRKALNANPNYTAARSALALTLTLEKRNEEAISEYRKLIAQCPENSDKALYHYNLGYILGRQGHRQEAEAQYRDALRLRPNYAKAHYNLGGILEMKKQLEEARTHYREALSLDATLPRPSLLDAKEQN